MFPDKPDGNQIRDPDCWDLWNQVSWSLTLMLLEPQRGGWKRKRWNLCYSSSRDMVLKPCSFPSWENCSCLLPCSESQENINWGWRDGLVEKTFLCWKTCGNICRGLTAAFLRVLKGLRTRRTYWNWGRWGLETPMNFPVLNPPLQGLEQRRATMKLSFCKIFFSWFINQHPPLQQSWNHSYIYFF